MDRCSHCAGTGDKFDTEINDWTDPLEDCDYCGGCGEDLTLIIAEADKDLAEGKTFSFADVFKEGSK